MNPFSILFITFVTFNLVIIPNPLYWKLYVELVIVGICGIYVLLNLSQGRRKLPLALIWVLLYWLMLIVSSIYSVNQFFSFSYSLLYAPVLLIAYNAATQSLDNKTDPLMIVKWYFTLTILMSLTGYLFLGDKFYTIEGGIRRLHGVYGEPATLATVCALNIGCMIFSSDRKIVRYSVIAITFVCLVLTGTRAGLVAVVGSLLFVGVFGQRKNLKVYLTLILILTTIFVAYTLLPKGSMEISYARSTSIENLSGRTNLWKTVIPNALRKPLGYGFCLGGAALSNEVKLWNVEKEVRLLGEASAKHTVHSGYLQALCDLGILGFTIYLIIILIGLVKAFYLVKIKYYLPYVYIFNCLVIYNITESIIMSPLSTSVLLFWLTWFVFLKSKKYVKMGS